MTKQAFDKIHTGLTEAIAVAKGWNHDISAAPRGKIVPYTRKGKDGPVQSEQYRKEYILAVDVRGVVAQSYWIPPRYTQSGALLEGNRWSGFNPGVDPIAWAPWPEYDPGNQVMTDPAPAIHALTLRETAWCGAFVGMVIATALPKEPMPANPLGSRNWLKFGKPLNDPQIGAIAVFWRGSKDGWQGHVGIVVGHDKTHLHILGGNQSDSVSIARIAKTRLLGYRWAVTYQDAPFAALPMTTISASVTTNEA